MKHIAKTHDGRILALDDDHKPIVINNACIYSPTGLYKAQFVLIDGEWVEANPKHRFYPEKEGWGGNLITDMQ